MATSLGGCGCCLGRWLGLVSELQFPCLTDEIMAEAMVWLLSHQHEAGFLVQASRLHEHIICPEHDLGVAATTREADTFGNEAGAYPQASRLWLDEEEPQLRYRFAGLHQKDGPDDFAVHLGDPAAFALGVEVVDEV